MSGTKSAVGLSVSGMGIAGGSVGASVQTARNFKLSERLAGLIAEKPLYTNELRRPGDVFFHCDDQDNIGHSNLTAADTTYKIDSMDPEGVRRVPMVLDTHFAIVFRFRSREVADRASRLAEEWTNTYDVATGTYARDGVGYSDRAVGTGFTTRSVGLVLGTSKFGIGARGRLAKYRRRDGMLPKNVTCAEMVILAYQLSMTEHQTGFIPLDAKHTTPSRLFGYMTGAGQAYWTVVAFRQFGQ